MKFCDRDLGLGSLPRSPLRKQGKNTAKEHYTCGQKENLPSLLAETVQIWKQIAELY